jgi:tetraacyldisaccharide 4'-kinase
MHPIADQFWYRIRPAHLILYPLSLLFGVGVAVRRLLYRAGALRVERMPVPVIVVGNITVGGTGKTPLVLWLAQRLLDSGLRPGIITRGYRGTERLQEVTPRSDPAQTGDEALLLARRALCPVFAARDRVAAGRALLATYPDCDVLISDDGLQHYRLARDIEIAVVDGERALGNGLLLPAGPLRESKSRLERVDAVVFNGKQSAGLPRGFEMRLDGSRFSNLADPTVTRAAGAFAGQKLQALAGIGNPQRFFDALRTLGLSFTSQPFPDHYAYAREDLDFPGADAVLMTEKDAVKCTSFAQDNWWYLPVDARVDPALGALVLARLRSRPHGHGP